MSSDPCLRNERFRIRESEEWWKHPVEYWEAYVARKEQEEKARDRKPTLGERIRAKHKALHGRRL